MAFVFLSAAWKIWFICMEHACLSSCFPQCSACRWKPFLLGLCLFSSFCSKSVLVTCCSKMPGCFSEKENFSCFHWCVILVDLKWQWQFFITIFKDTLKTTMTFCASPVKWLLMHALALGIWTLCTETRNDSVICMEYTFLFMLTCSTVCDVWSQKHSSTQLTWCVYCNSLLKEIRSSDSPAGRGLSTHRFNSWFCYTAHEFGVRFTTQIHHTLHYFHVNYIHTYELGTKIPLLCNILFMLFPLLYLGEMSCRQMLYPAIDPWGAGGVLC